MILTRRQFNRQAALLAAAGLVGGSRLTATTEAAILPRGYKLVWEDNFNRNGRPDPKNWGFEHGFVRNRELQWYQPQNAFCQDGFLFIEARRQEVRNPHFRAGSHQWQTRRPFAHYTSSSLTTHIRIDMTGVIFHDVDFPAGGPRVVITEHPPGWPHTGVCIDSSPHGKYAILPGMQSAGCQT